MKKKRYALMVAILCVVVMGSLGGLSFYNLLHNNKQHYESNLNNNDIKEFHTKMWIFCHGIATLVANNTINIDNKQIEELLSLQFQALMLLEEKKDNKWVLPNLEER